MIRFVVSEPIYYDWKGLSIRRDYPPELSVRQPELTKRMIKHVIFAILRCEGVIYVPHDELICARQKKEILAQDLMKSLQALGAPECRLEKQTVSFRRPAPPPTIGSSYGSPFIYVGSGQLNVNIDPEAILIKYRVYPYWPYCLLVISPYIIGCGWFIIRAFSGMGVSVVDLYIFNASFAFGFWHVASVYRFTRIIKTLVRDMMSSCEV